MFEGLLSPWHIVIIVAAVFLVFGPEKLAARWRDGMTTITRLVDDEHPPSAEPEAIVEAPAPKPSLAQRLGRRLARRRRRRS